MSELLHELPLRAAANHGDRPALVDGKRTYSYAEFASQLDHFASGLLASDVGAGERVAINLPKSLEAVVSMFGTAHAGGVFVPINALLKPAQVEHILIDCAARILVTTAGRLTALVPHLENLPQLHTVVLIDKLPALDGITQRVVAFSDFLNTNTPSVHRRIDADVAAIFYTSGSTGRPKGVVLSHANMVAGAHSVASYLENTQDDRILAALTLSFDAGFSQLSTGFSVGACIVLLEYLLPRDVLRKMASERITGLGGVPPLWGQLAALEWPEGCADTMRYFTNTGGAMPKATLSALREKAPGAAPYLMYGLTEAFRSTYLPPEQVDARPESIGKAIPNAEVMVLDENGVPCKPGEVGELVHRGALVSLGYWNNPDKTAERFKPLPLEDGRVVPELAVFSGDSVRMDDEGYLYFVGRRDEMIKTSGYRVSPNEIEEVIYDAGVCAEVIAMGAPHPQLGQAIVIIAAKPKVEGDANKALLAACRSALANFMQPKEVVWLDARPRNPNGKIDRKTLSDQHQHLFTDDA
ncbi:MAG: acyl-CoA ligase (AMP-forming), exosortase A system-associated [Gammaproteobacteria bacterium]